MKKVEHPQKVGTSQVLGDEYRHPAYGCVIVGHSTIGGEGMTLFRSELQHRSCMTLTIKSAKKYVGSHQSENHFGDQTIVEISLSESQWAAMVSGVGVGGGIPCTITYGPKPGYELEAKPEIPYEDLHLKIGSTVKADTRKAVADLVTTYERLVALADKPSKTELKKLLFTMKCQLENLPANMEFQVEKIAETTNKLVDSAKLDIEAFGEHVVRELGLNALKSAMPALPKPDLTPFAMMCAPDSVLDKTKDKP